jgi:hypothetical protein
MPDIEQALAMNVAMAANTNRTRTAEGRRFSSLRVAGIVVPRPLPDLNGGAVCDLNSLYQNGPLAQIRWKAGFS